MNLKLRYFNLDQMLDGCFVALIAVLFGYILFLLASFAWLHSIAGCTSLPLAFCGDAPNTCLW